MLKINEDDYAYASARIRAKEPRLLRSGQFDRMLDAGDADEAFRVLTESGYGSGDGGKMSASGFEKVLADEMKKCYLLLEEIAPQIEVVRAFQRRHDYFNIKVLLKAEFLKKEAPPILSDTGTFGKKAVARMIRERDYGEMTPMMKQAVEEVYDVFPRKRDPQEIDLILDRASYSQFSADLKETDSPFLQSLAEMITDVTNIKIFVRARTLDKSWDFIRKLLLRDGTIDGKIYAENSDKPVEAFISGIHGSACGEAAEKGWKLYVAKRNISGLEKTLDDYLMQFVRKAKLVTMGVEPLAAWLFAKEAEIRNVRIVMTGRINRLPVERIRERLRLGYV